jgi:hypothetical protein
MWFAAAVLFAVVAAGTIVYRAANDDIRVALRDTASAPAAHLRRFCDSAPFYGSARLSGLRPYRS